MASKRTSPGAAPRVAKKRAARKAKAESTGLEPAQCLDDVSTPAVRALMERIEREGGAALGAYRDPYGGHPLVLALLPTARVEATPFQRDLSDIHHKRLSQVIAKTGRFLDPIVAITAPADGFWTPNGRHRLEAMRRLGTRSITALVVPDREVAWQILALNTERALEVIRICRDLLAQSGPIASATESSFGFYLEDPSLVTLGICYEKHARFAGGAYHPVLRRTERFSDSPLATALEVHERLADLVLALEERVAATIARLRERGLTSPYLRSFVVARINPLRWIKGDPPPAAKVLAQMRERAEKFNVDRVKQEDLARATGGAAPDDDG